MSIEPVVHVGYPKTATTTLQQACRSLPGVAYLGKGLFGRSGDDAELSRRLLSAILCDDETTFEGDRGRIHQEVVAFADGRPLVVSDEALTFGAFMGRARRWSRPVDSRAPVVASRLGRLFPGYRLLVGLRRQDRLVASYYRQQSKLGTTGLGFRAWFEEISGRPGFLESLDFHAVLRTFVAAGSGALHAFDFDCFAEAEVRAAIAAFVASEARDALAAGLASQHENPDTGRLPGPLRRLRAWPLARRLLALTPAAWRRRARIGLSQAHPMEGAEEIGEKLVARFAPSNALLEGEFGVALR